MQPKAQNQKLISCAGFSLEEVIISLAVSSLTIGGIISGYLLCSQRAEWAGYAAAAQSLAAQRFEQVRAATWDPLAYPPVDQVVTENFPPVKQSLGVPVSQAGSPEATVETTIKTLSSDPHLKSIEVQCVWSYWNRGPFTNTLSTFRAPDQ